MWGKEDELGDGVALERYAVEVDATAEGLEVRFLLRQRGRHLRLRCVWESDVDVPPCAREPHQESY